MIYVSIAIYRSGCAYITANDEAGFRDMFREVVYDYLNQYKTWVRDVSDECEDRIKADMSKLPIIPVDEMLEFSYDLGLNDYEYWGKINVDEVFLDKESAQKGFQDWVDELNQDVAEEDEKWAVFGGGFFPLDQGYEIEEVFK